MAVVRMKEAPGGWEKVLEGEGVANATKAACKQIISVAQQVFEEQARHTKESTHIHYVDSFRIERAGGGFFRRAFKVVNVDPVANLVEFGAHPGGGSTFTLRYRPLGRAVEILSIE